ncbi:MAG: Pyruvate/2-oxoglutarate dehydrogenase complex dihydrolipoamide dehydrogenase component [Herminiimonas sp.]|nr:Pyruvate/2-oxoglutarate dehydrogenase complex dihydrolipoamide dehydrogenase component [Herminiimonas sp.]MDB5855344.1 Pyruvate/2-oxoglutarate dehydrogenase complex dihydrolipoamide dehydrogenase component [Herminiimonas sp.]
MSIARDQYDVVVIGAGQAGIPLSKHLAATGKRVAIAEQEHLGGSCINFGCTPSKAAIASARVAHMARRAAEYGVTVGSVSVDFDKVMARAQGMADASRTSLERIFSADSNPALLRGHAMLTGRDGPNFLVSVGAARIIASQVVLDTGTRTQMPDVEGLDTIDALTSENWVARRSLPKQVLMIGGGYIGLEMGQFYRRMGSEVVIVQGASQIAPHEDSDIAEELQRRLEQEGIRFKMNSLVRRVRPSHQGLLVSTESAGTGEEIECTDVFVAAGRQPNTSGLGLETLGVRTSTHGLVEINDKLETNVPGIWAAGDIRGGAMFTHTSWDDFRILASQMVGDGRRTTERVIPYAIFTDPEVGRVGMTEQEARKTGREIRVGRFNFEDNGKAKEIGEAEGFIKVVVEASSGRLMGAAVLGPQASELVHLYVTLMNAQAPYTVMEDAIHIHPTLAEALQSAVAVIAKG